jgi:serine/threonine protein kinase
MSRALGRYELLRPLARGGMADVYLARRRAAGIEKWLVVKRMRPETSGDPRFLDLFVREARLSMSLVHQNIVPVFDFGKIDDQVFLAMERVEGKDLGSSLARAPRRRLPALLAAFVAAECCQALDYAHQRKGPDGIALGIVHRDVTPRNVLLSWSGEVKLTDFGIAALAGDVPSRLLGTPHYMAPEQVRGKAVDARTDIYALGALAYHLVCGRPPFAGDNPIAIGFAHLSEPVLPPRQLRRDVPAGLDAAIVAALAKTPDERPPSAKSFIDQAYAAA